MAPLDRLFNNHTLCEADWCLKQMVLDKQIAKEENQKHDVPSPHAHQRLLQKHQVAYLKKTYYKTIYLERRLKVAAGLYPIGYHSSWGKYLTLSH